MQALHEAAQRLTVALDRVIDINAYPLPEARNSNQRHRPIGIGVQGLADVFAMLEIPYDSAEAAALNEEIFETVHHAALTASTERAQQMGAYSSFEGSPASHGVLQCDMWDKKPQYRDWEPLRAAIHACGLRNSLLTAPMPTASTAQIAGNTESFEPRTSNAYVRRVLSGEFMVINPHLVRALDKRGLWPALRVPLLKAGGSVQGLAGVPDDVREVFKTAWEMKSKPLVDMAVGRAPYIDQSQSFNMFMQNPTGDRISKAHMYAWRQGLKTGMYYLHTRPASEAVQFALVDTTKATAKQPDEDKNNDHGEATENEGHECLSCGA
jgi:ribonucleotide reductase alpha subunit